MILLVVMLSLYFMKTNRIVYVIRKRAKALFLLMGRKSVAAALIL